MLDFTKYRFEGETILVKVLEEDFGLKNYYEIFNNEEGLKDVVNSLLSRGVKLNKVIAPRLYQICNNVKETLNYNEEIDFFIISDVDFNAYSINGFGFVPHMICLTSSLVQSFTDDELAFVIGHEIGHLIYQHSQLNIVRSLLMNSQSQKVSTQVANTIYRWQKYAEISSDRMGYIAQPCLETIGKVFFKFASGLCEEHLKFNIKEYLKQLDMLKDMSRNEFYSSHPSHLVRLKCLEFFSQSELYSKCEKTPMSMTELKTNMDEILNLLEYHPQKEDQIKAVEFYVSVGMYLASADRTMHPKEREIIYECLSQLTSQPELYLRFKNRKDLEDRKNAICEYYAQSRNDYKFHLYANIVYLAICDGKLDENERKILYEIAERLQIDEERMKEIIIEVSRHINPTTMTHNPKDDPFANYFD